MAAAKSRVLRHGADPLDRPLLRLSANDYLDVRGACENVLVIGGIGSGKTSGPGRALRRALFSAGAGALVLVNKPDEIAACIQDARATGRTKSVLIVDGSRGFNFIEHEMRRHSLAGVGTVVEFLMKVLEIVKLAMPNGGRQGEAFWENRLPPTPAHDRAGALCRLRHRSNRRHHPVCPVRADERGGTG